jgi:uncharacterized UBP type Zn finger protein
MAATHRLLNMFLRRAWTGQFTRRPCSHLDMINNVQPASEVCQQCVALGDSWPALRMCLSCGHVGCCEKTKHQHALKHFQATGHPLVRPYKERGMNWIWCYLDKTLLDSPTYSAGGADRP